MSVLSELFQDIADAIRTKTGGTDTMAPASFPTEILSIVTGGIVEGGGERDFCFAEGSLGGFSDDAILTGRQTITHGLGVMPDLVLVYPWFTAALSDAPTEIFAFGLNSKFPTSVKNIVGFQQVNDLGDDGVGGNVATNAYPHGMDETTDGERSDGVISTPDDNTFEVGGNPKWVMYGVYKWFAIAGMGGAISNDLRYVTFLNYDGTELGKKPVAVGDDARYIFDTPTRLADAQYTYTHSGWSTTQGGDADSNALKSVNEDRTLYATFKGTVRSYTITYYDSDGTTVLKTETLAYGAMPSYTPTSEQYIFSRWEPEVTAVTGDASYTAVWSEKPAFSNLSWEEIGAICAAGNAAATFSVGDEKDVTVTYADGTTEVVTFVIGSFGMFASSNIDLISKHALKETRRLSDTGKDNFWNLTAIQWLQNTFVPALPSDMQSLLKNNAMYRKCMPPSLKYLGLTSVSGYTDNSYAKGVSPLFTENSDRIKKLGQDGAAVEYFTADDSYISGGSYVFVIGTDGARSNNSQYHSYTAGIVPIVLL